MRYLGVSSQGNVALSCGKQLPIEAVGKCLVFEDIFQKSGRG